MKRTLIVLLLIGLAATPFAEAKMKLTPRQRYNRIVSKVGQPYYGLTERPAATFGKVPVKPPGVQGPVDAVTTYDPAPTIHFGRSVSKQLTSRDPRQRRFSRRIVLWELGRAAHPPQNDTDAAFGTPWLRNQTDRVSRQLNKQQAQRRRQSELHRALRARD